MTTTTIEPKYRIITLTGRRPVKIRENQWPILAEGRWYSHDGKIAAQANRTWDLSIRVRQHADGRAIVYGVYDYDTSFQGEACFVVKSGRLCAASYLPVAITAVGDVLRDRIAYASENAREGAAHVADVVAECIGELPAETLE